MTLCYSRAIVSASNLSTTRYQDGRFLFASEVRALLATDIVARKLDRQAVGSFLWHGFVPALERS